jgi:hypothetical protein
MTITNTTPVQPVAPTPAKPPTEKAEPARHPVAAKTDSVQLSAAGQAALAALQEASETPAQTAKEAGSGDPQAQRLLAREATVRSAFG